MSQLKIRDSNNQWVDIPASGAGVPGGGVTGSVLTKRSNENFATQWTLPLSIKLLWTNPDPTASFAAQTVSLDLSGYDAILIAFLGNGDTSRQMAQICFEGGNVLVGSIEASSGVRTRKATVSSSGIVFTDAYNDGASANGVCIPYKIYGIKGIT